MNEESNTRPEKLPNWETEIVEEFSNPKRSQHRLTETDDFIEDTISQPLRIVYRDEHYIAVFKPAGLMVHRGHATRPGEPILLQTLRDQIGQHVFPVHRLDRPTAGLILLALNGQAAAKMVELFTLRRVDKHYQALVSGELPDCGLIESPLTDPRSESTDGKFSGDFPPQEAKTNFVTLAKYLIHRPETVFEKTQFSLLEIKPQTGRWHQIRRHFSYMDRPVIGDLRHGEKRHNELIVSCTGVDRMLLTSMRLDFRHPYTDEPTSILVGRGSQFDQVMTDIEQFRVGGSVDRNLIMRTLRGKRHRLTGMTHCD